MSHKPARHMSCMYFLSTFVFIVLDISCLKMVPLKTLTWLQSVVTCGNIYLGKNSSLFLPGSLDDLNKPQVIQSVEPWTILQAFTAPLPGNCVAVLLSDDALEDPKGVMSYMDKSRMSITLVFVVRRMTLADINLSNGLLREREFIIAQQDNGYITGEIFQLSHLLLHQYVFLSGSKMFTLLLLIVVWLESCWCPWRRKLNYTTVAPGNHCQIHEEKNN